MQPPLIEIKDGPHPCGEENRYGVAWQGVSIIANTEIELNEIIAGYEKKFWHPWIIGVTIEDGQPSAFLFKPKDCRCEWREPDDLDRKKSLIFDDQKEGIRLMGVLSGGGLYAATEAVEKLNQKSSFPTPN